MEMKNCDLRDAITDELLQGHCTTLEGAADITFKVKRSKVKVTRPLWLAVLGGQHGHQVSD